MQASYLTASLLESDQIKENQHLTMAWTVGKGCRSLGLGNLGIRSSGLMFIWKHWIKRILKILTLKMKAQWHLSAISYFFYYLSRKICAMSDYPDFGFAGTEVQVQAPLKTFIDEALVCRHQAKAGILLG